MELLYVMHRVVDTRYKYQGKSEQEVPTREHVEIKLLLPHLIVVQCLIKCKYRALNPFLRKMEALVQY